MFLRYVTWSLLAVIALAVAALGVVQNARYGAWLDAASGAQTVAIFGLAFGGFGVTFAVMNAFKVLSLPAIMEAWARGNRAIAVTCFAGFIGLAALSIWNVTALQTIARDDKGARQEIERQRLAGLKAELAEVEARAKALGEARLTGEIEAALAAIRVDRRWSSSQECRDATATASRTFCADYQREFGELTRANEIEQSRTKIERLRGEIAQRTTVGAIQLADPELQRLTEATGLDPVALGWWRALVFAVIFELVEASAWTLAWVVKPSNTERSIEGQDLPPKGVIVFHPAAAAKEALTCPEAFSAPTEAPRLFVAEPAPEPAPVGANAGLRPARTPSAKPAPRPALTLVSSGVAPAPAAPTGQVRDIGPEVAVAAFVATLLRTASSRVTSGELFAAYEAARRAHGWPQLTATAFGRYIKTAIERAGGRKIKSNGQQVYVGVALPLQGAQGAA